MLKKYVLASILFLVLTISTYYVKSFINYEVKVKEVFDNSDLKSNCKVKEILENEKHYIVKGYIPFTNYTNLNNEIEKNINAYIVNFKKDIDKITLVNDKKYTLEISFESYEYKEYISYVINIFSDLGGAHPNSYIYTISYDTKKQKIVTLKNIIEKNTSFLNQVSKYTYSNLKQNSKIKEANQEDILLEGTKSTENNFKNFVFDKDGIIIFFEKYQVAPYVYGEFSVTIPYSYLNMEI